MTSALDEKDSYEELTDKQQRVVDELVETPTAQNQDVADRADVSRSTVYNVKEKYGDIVESQLNQVGRYDGDETTEGDPFEGQLDQQQEWQTIKERPVGVERIKESETEAEERDVITVRLHRQDIERILLDGGVSDEFRRELVNRILESTFTDAKR
jgi:hypothetical protein